MNNLYTAHSVYPCLLGAAVWCLFPLSAVYDVSSTMTEKKCTNDDGVRETHWSEKAAESRPNVWHLDIKGLTRLILAALKFQFSDSLFQSVSQSASEFLSQLVS